MRRTRGDPGTANRAAVFQLQNPDHLVLPHRKEPFMHATTIVVEGHRWDRISAYDAGTCYNDEACASIPGPFVEECGGPGGGAP